MGATSITGVGPGDSHKRLAYLSSDLPRQEFTKTTTNDQDLITGEIEGGGCTCDFDTEWELIYSNSTVDGPPIATGVFYDPLYTWAFGIKVVSDSPPAFTLSLIPVTDPILYKVIDLYSYRDFVGMSWSPDGGSNIFQFNFQSHEFSILRPSMLPIADDITVLEYNVNTTIEIEAGTGEFETYFGVAPPSDTAYFVIARKRIVVL